MRPYYTLLFFTVFLFKNAFSQNEVVFLKNPSFEGSPGAGTLDNQFLPSGWFNCGHANESPPDVHPMFEGGPFGVRLNSKDGKTYLGMVVRSNGTWEQAGQKLNSSLRAGVAYGFSIHLSRSRNYTSPDRKTLKLENYNEPVVLRIWGGKSRCDQHELLAVSAPVANASWKAYKFVLKPTEDCSHIVLEAFYQNQTTQPYNGNILLDHASAFKPTMDTANLALPAAASPFRHEFAEPHMGTEFRIILISEDQTQAETTARAAFDKIAALEKIMSDYLEDSEVNLLANNAGAGTTIPVSDDLWRVLTYARDISKRSNGAFDVTTGALTKLWRRAFRQKIFPDTTAIAEALKTVGWSDLEFLKNKTIRLRKEGMRLDLGGIAKGYAIDEAMKIIQQNGINSALIDGGGDISVSNAPPGEIGWRIKHPAVKEGELTMEIILAFNAAIATSGDTFKFLEWNGQRYSHILDPRTGLGLTSQHLVTVIAPTCMAADAWATALSVEPDQEIVESLRKQGIEVAVTRY